MKIQPTNILSFQKIVKTAPKSVFAFMSNPLKEDTFTKSNDFNLNSAMWNLQNVKNSKNKPKLNDYYLQTIKSNLQETPEKWPAIESIAKNPKIEGEFVYMMAIQPLDKLNEMKFYSEVKSENNEPKYNGKELMNFMDKASTEELSKVRPLAKTALAAKNIVEISHEENLPDLNKLADKIIELETEQKSSMKEIELLKDNYDNNEFIVKATNQDNSTISKAYDKNFNLQWQEKTEENQEKQTFTRTTEDFRNNTTSEVLARLDKKVGRPVVLNEKRIIKDKSNNLIRTEFASPSDVMGVLNIKHVDKDGKETIISSGSIDKKTGITSVKKNMTSFDGTKTEYLYENDPAGNRILDYKITDKNGKVLLQNSEAFEILSPNKFITSKNDEKYEINVSNDEIKVQDLKNKEKTASFKIGKEIKGKPQEILNSLKQMPGGELIKMRENIDKLESMDDSLDSFYSGSARTIHTGDNVFLLLHEIGHAIDFKNTDSSSGDKYQESLKNTISMNKDVNEIYNAEKETFLKEFPNAQRHHIDYFINSEKHPAGEAGGIGETIAETNALINSPKTHEALSYRSQYLQQYFPRTLAKVAEHL